MIGHSLRWYVYMSWWGRRSACVVERLPSLYTRLAVASRPLPSVPCWASSRGAGAAAVAGTVAAAALAAVAGATSEAATRPSRAAAVRRTWTSGRRRSAVATRRWRRLASTAGRSAVWRRRRSGDCGARGCDGATAGDADECNADGRSRPWTSCSTTSCQYQAASASVPCCWTSWSTATTTHGGVASLSIVYQHTQSHHHHQQLSLLVQSNVIQRYTTIISIAAEIRKTDELCRRGCRCLRHLDGLLEPWPLTSRI